MKNVGNGNKNPRATLAWTSPMIRRSTGVGWPSRLASDRARHQISNPKPFQNGHDFLHQFIRPHGTASWRLPWPRARHPSQVLSGQVGLQHLLCGDPQPESDSQPFGRRFPADYFCHDLIQHFKLIVIQAHRILWQRHPLTLLSPAAGRGVRMAGSIKYVPATSRDGTTTNASSSPSPFLAKKGERKTLDSRWIPDDKRRGPACGNDRKRRMIRPGHAYSNARSLSWSTMLWPFIFRTKASSAVTQGNPRISARAT